MRRCDACCASLGLSRQVRNASETVWVVVCFCGGVLLRGVLLWWCVFVEVVLSDCGVMLAAPHPTSRAGCGSPANGAAESGARVVGVQLLRQEGLAGDKQNVHQHDNITAQTEHIRLTDQVWNASDGKEGWPAQPSLTCRRPTDAEVPEQYSRTAVQ